MASEPHLTVEWAIFLGVQWTSRLLFLEENVSIWQGEVDGTYDTAGACVRYFFSPPKEETAPSFSLITPPQTYGVENLSREDRLFPT